MKILIIGATGFIGKSIYKRLEYQNYDVLAGVRNPTLFAKEAIEIDFMHLDKDENLVQKLRGVEVVVNAVGIIAQQNGQTFKQMHTIAPIALFDACKEAEVKKIIHISALGSQNGTTPYHTSKNEADIYLRKLGVPYAILHPSIVYGEGGKSTALFEALASLPLTPIIGDGSQLLQPIALNDLINSVIRAIKSKEEKIEFNLVGEDVVTYKELLQGFRQFLNRPATKSISVPTFGTDFIGKILDEPTVNSDNIIMLNQGNSADITPLSDFLDYTPIGIKKNLFNKKANNAQKLYASLYLVSPILRLIIGFVWIWSGVVSAFLYPQPLALDLLHEVGISSSYDVFVLYGASFLDIVLGICIILNFKLRALLLFSFVVIVGYTLILTLLASHHWFHPFGAILKNLPLLVSIYMLIQMEKYR